MAIACGNGNIVPYTLEALKLNTEKTSGHAPPNFSSLLPPDEELVKIDEFISNQPLNKFQLMTGPVGIVSEDQPAIAAKSRVIRDSNISAVIGELQNLADENDVVYLYTVEKVEFKEGLIDPVSFLPTGVDPDTLPTVVKYKIRVGN